MDREGVRFDVREHGRRAHQRDRFGRRREGERGHNHLVTRPDVDGAQRQHQRVRPVGAADHLRAPQGGGNLLLQRLDLGAEDEATTLEHRGDRQHNLAAQGGVLAIDGGDGDAGLGSGRGHVTVSSKRFACSAVCSRPERAIRRAR